MCLAALLHGMADLEKKAVGNAFRGCIWRIESVIFPWKNIACGVSYCF